MNGFWEGFYKQAKAQKTFEDIFSDPESREQGKKKAPMDQCADYAYMPEMFAGESVIQGRANYG